MMGSCFARVPVSSRGQDTWFSATGPGFESPYRYHLSKRQAISDFWPISRPGLAVGEALIAALDGYDTISWPFARSRL